MGKKERVTSSGEFQTSGGPCVRNEQIPINQSHTRKWNNKREKYGVW